MLAKRNNHRGRWTEAEDAELRRRCEAGDFLEDIAKDFQRTAEGVRTRANVLGFLVGLAEAHARAPRRLSGKPLGARGLTARIHQGKKPNGLGRLNADVIVLAPSGDRRDWGAIADFHQDMLTRRAARAGLEEHAGSRKVLHGRGLRGATQVEPRGYVQDSALRPHLVLRRQAIVDLFVAGAGPRERGVELDPEILSSRPSDDAGLIGFVVQGQMQDLVHGQSDIGLAPEAVGRDVVDPDVREEVDRIDRCIQEDITAQVPAVIGRRVRVRPRREDSVFQSPEHVASSTDARP